MDLQLPVQSVPFTTNIVSSNPMNGEVYLIQHCVIKFVSDLRQVGVFIRFPPPIKMNTTIINEILLKVALNTINQTFIFAVYSWTICKNIIKLKIVSISFFKSYKVQYIGRSFMINIKVVPIYKSALACHGIQYIFYLISVFFSDLTLFPF